ncbi:TBC1 domain family member 25 [Plakobranchus ocellatus]|uniref:TBC1 domain family member 25 n=1 Tax=Plakobranchus ocellatus TaxID=259542 RepID=A0AAV3Z011_9GAST|nr:TBC1 domain family member 25 [Plakobranchus ocellatus]
MAGFYNLDHKEVIRIKVKKCDGKMQPEYKKFSIDPQITSFDMLQGILARAFEIRSDFTISYLAMDSEGQSVYLTMLSDWDMDAAFQCAADPCLKLKVDLRPFEKEMEDWDVIAPADIPHHKISSLLDKNSFLFSLTGSISQNIGRTVNSMQRAMGLKQSENDAIKPLKPPMSDMEFHNYLDSAGFMVKPNEFRLSIYQGGIDTSLRRVAWRHLLNIYPANMSGRDRFDYMKRKGEEYRKLREEWSERFRNNTATEEVKYVAAMVKKDVLRTDRTHDFYAGADDNENTLSLFHILVTYALTHPDVSYCQGMSDLASPLLVTQKDEGQAYICFCALMRRLRENFSLEGRAMMTKFSHLSMLVAMYDPGLYAHFQEQSAMDMFFCYRWFLLELKREFPFSDALYFLEVMWATLPPDPPAGELPLVDSDYSSRLLSSSPCSPTFTFRQAMYAKLLAMRRVGAMSQLIPTHGPQPISKNTDKDSNTNSEDSSLTPRGTSPPCGAVSNISSFNSSPTGEFGSGDFPEVDNPLIRSVQRRSQSIDQVLLEGPEEAEDADEDEGTFCDGNNPEEVEGGKKNKGKTKSVKGREGNRKYSSTDLREEGIEEAEERNEAENIQLVSNHFGSAPYKSSNVLEIGTDCSEKSCSRAAHRYDQEAECRDCELARDDDRVRFMLSVSSGDLDCGDSGITSEVSESYEQQTQFALSMDSNTNNCTGIKDDILEEVTPDTCHIHSSESNYPMSVPACANTSESNSGIFQSMKRLLTSPKRRNSSSPVQDGRKSPTLSPKHIPSAPSLINTCERKPRFGTENSGDSNPIKTRSEPRLSDCQPATELAGNASNSENSTAAAKVEPPRDPSSLPPPQEFGCGNPFLMFASLTLLLQHRDTILGGSLCYEEIAMHFDRLVRRHNAARVLHSARQMYTNYLRAQQANIEKAKDEELGLSC